MTIILRFYLFYGTYIATYTLFINLLNYAKDCGMMCMASTHILSLTTLSKKKPSLLYLGSFCFPVPYTETFYKLSYTSQFQDASLFKY